MRNGGLKMWPEEVVTVESRRDNFKIQSRLSTDDGLTRIDSTAPGQYSEVSKTDFAKIGIGSEMIMAVLLLLLTQYINRLLT